LGTDRFGERERFLRLEGRHKIVRGRRYSRITTAFGGLGVDYSREKAPSRKNEQDLIPQAVQENPGETFVLGQMRDESNRGGKGNRGPYLRTTWITRFYRGNFERGI